MSKQPSVFDLFSKSQSKKWKDIPNESSVDDPQRWPQMKRVHKTNNNLNQDGRQNLLIDSNILNKENLPSSKLAHCQKWKVWGTGKREFGRLPTMSEIFRICKSTTDSFGPSSKIRDFLLKLTPKFFLFFFFQFYSSFSFTSFGSQKNFFQG